MRFVRVSTIKDTESVERGRIYSDGSRVIFTPPDDRLVRTIANGPIVVMVSGKLTRVSSSSPDLFLDNLCKQYRNPHCRVSLPEPGDDTTDNRSFFAECERDEKGYCLPAGGAGGVTEKEYKVAAAKAKEKAKKAPKPTKEEIAHANNRMDKIGADKYESLIRGNTSDRAASRQRLLKEFGDGKTCPCVFCGLKLDDTTVTRDKIYTAREGGRYRHGNLVPSCLDCNKTRGDVPFREIEWK